MKKPKLKREKVKAPQKGKTKETKISVTPPKFSFYPLILILLLGVLCYSNTLHGPFVFDDAHNIVKLEGIHLNSFSYTNLAKLGQTAWEKGRPVALISFALNYYFGGLNTFGYHLVNLSIHLLNTILVYLFIQLTLNLPSLQERYGELAHEIALLSSLLFVVHPIQIQAVSYIVQRMTSLAAFFFLLALYCYAKGRLTEGKLRTTYFVGTAMAMLLALGSKQNTVTLPFFIAIYEYYFFQRLQLGQARKKWLYTVVGLILLVVLVAGIYTGFDVAHVLREGYKRTPFTPRQRMLTQLRVVVFYLSLLIVPLPSRLNLDHHFPLSYSLSNPPTTLICLFSVLGLIIVSIYLARKRPLISFSLIWFWGNLALESSFLPLKLVFEHRLYLPSVGFFLFVSILLIKGVESFKTQAQAKVGIKVGLLLVLIIPLSLLTYQRNKIWQDDLALWEDVVKKSPRKPEPHSALGHIYAGRGRLTEAIVQHKRALEIEPRLKGVRNALGAIYLRQGRVEQAVTEFLEEIKHYPDNTEAHYNLGIAYQRQKALIKAIAQFQRILAIDPGFKDAHNNLGDIYLQQGKLEQAIAELFKEIKHHPDNAKAYYNLGYAYTDQGRLEEAIVQYKHVLKIDPGIRGTHNNLGLIYLEQGKPEQATPEFLEEIKHHPDSTKAYYNLADAYRKRGLEQKATWAYQRASKMEQFVKDQQKHPSP